MQQEPLDVEEKQAFDLLKVGKMTKIWVTRRYVFHNHVMYIYERKSDI